MQCSLTTIIHISKSILCGNDIIYLYGLEQLQYTMSVYLDGVKLSSFIKVLITVNICPKYRTKDKCSQIPSFQQKTWLRMFKTWAHKVLVCLYLWWLRIRAALLFLDTIYRLLNLGSPCWIHLKSCYINCGHLLAVSLPPFLNRPMRHCRK